MTTPRRIGVAVVGFGWMGEVHTRAYARVRHHFPHLDLAPQLVAVADEVDGRAEAACAQYGFARGTRRWTELVDDPTIDAVSVTAPNFLHREIAGAFAGAGKHVWVEKPVGVTSDDARAVADEVTAAGVQSAVGFNYRHAPAVAHTRALIAAGAIGTITNSRFRLFADYAAHSLGVLSWRFDRRRGGSGVLGDLASHGVDLARHLIGDITSVTADTATFVSERPRPAAAGSHYDVADEDADRGPVENEDYVGSLVRFGNGARGVIEASRVSVGDQCAYDFEIHGTRGYVAWDFRRMGELRVSAGDQFLNQPVSTVLTGPGHGDYGAFQPGAGIALSYDDLKVIEAERFLTSIATGRPHGATVRDAAASAAVLDAMVESHHRRGWVDVPSP